MSKKLVIKVTAGANEAERCSQAFTVAATAVASGIPVSLWLTGDASWFALPGKAEEFSLPHATALAQLRDQVIEGGRVTLCTQCAQRRDINSGDLLPGITIAGAASFLAEIMEPDTQALVY